MHYDPTKPYNFAALLEKETKCLLFKATLPEKGSQVAFMHRLSFGGSHLQVEEEDDKDCGRASHLCKE